MHIIEVAENFWNIRGSFKIGGLIDIRTHASLVKCADGRFIFLDSLTLEPEVQAEIDELTDGGEAVAAVINLHPFHTVHVEAMQAAYPKAKHYGTQRHIDNFPNLKWEPELAESAALHQLFADDLAFSVPKGVDFISANPKLHFSSVLAFHKASKTIHVDDTLMYTKLPKPIGESVSFHLTLAKTLEPRAEAVADFRAWVAELLEQWGYAQNLCTAHTHALLASKNDGASVKQRIENALQKVEAKLAKHEKKYG